MIRANAIAKRTITGQLLEIAMAQSFCAVMITDARLDGEGPVIEYCNAAMCEMTGYTEAELLGRSPRMLQGPLTDQLVLQRLHESLEQGLPFQGSVVNYRKDGSTYHVEWNISPVRDEKDVIRHFVAVQRDISERVQAEQERALLARALNATNDGILITDRDSTIVFVNQAFEALTGYSAAELLGQPTEMLRSGLHEPEFYAQLQEALSLGHNFRATFINRHKSGGVYYAEQSIAALRDESGQISHYVGASKDISRMVQREMELRERANRDKLTGLLNRHAGETELKRNQLQAQNQLRPYGVILGDIDLFKQVNDRFGHVAGDRVLKMVAHVLSGKVRRYDHAVRWGGEEFLIVLSDASLGVAAGLAERIRCAVEECADPEVGRFTISLGVGLWEPGETEDDLLKRADAALYRAKHRGRNQVAIATGSMNMPLVQAPELLAQGDSLTFSGKSPDKPWTGAASP